MLHSNVLEFKKESQTDIIRRILGKGEIPRAKKVCVNKYNSWDSHQDYIACELAMKGTSKAEVERVARELGISYSAFYGRMSKYRELHKKGPQAKRIPVQCITTYSYYLRNKNQKIAA